MLSISHADCSVLESFNGTNGVCGISITDYTEPPDSSGIKWIL